MRAMAIGFILCAFLLAASPAMALQVVSANGFNCTSQPVGGKSLVECMGQFQGVTGIFSATGYDMVHVDFTPDNQRRYSYMSETGCLILAASDKSALASDKSGAKKQFGSFMDAMQWCYTGGAPVGQQGQQPERQAAPPQTPQTPK